VLMLAGVVSTSKELIKITLNSPNSSDSDPFSRGVADPNLTKWRGPLDRDP
jgi:hypothetical protein